MVLNIPNHASNVSLRRRSNLSPVVYIGGKSIQKPGLGFQSLRPNRLVTVAFIAATALFVKASHTGLLQKGFKYKSMQTVLFQHTSPKQRECCKLSVSTYSSSHCVHNMRRRSTYPDSSTHKVDAHQPKRSRNPHDELTNCNYGEMTPSPKRCPLHGRISACIHFI